MFSQKTTILSFGARDMRIICSLVVISRWTASDDDSDAETVVLCE